MTFNNPDPEPASGLPFTLANGGPIPTETLRHVVQLLLVRGDPFRPSAAELRTRDQTRFVSQDARRAIVLKANSVTPGYIKPLTEMRDLPMEDAYAGRSETQLHLGARVADELQDDLKTTWAWPEAASTDEFYTRYSFLRPDSPLQEHYAERLFFQEVLLPVLGAGGLARVEAQVPFNDENGKQRYIDFVVRGAKDYAIEVEGATHHDEALITVQVTLALTVFALLGVGVLAIIRS